MDQESGRRRSSRLAARGVSTPRAEAVKKALKSSEKPKRTKRKTPEEVVELPDAKKNKPSEEIDNPEDVEENEVSGVTPLDEGTNETNVEETDKPTIEEKTDTPTQDSTEEIIENIPVANEENEKADSSLTIDDKKKLELPEDTIKIKDPEQPKNDVTNEETKQEPVVLEKSNGTIDDKETAVPVEITKSNDIGFCVATKDIVTPNGDANDQVKSTNGDESITKSEAIKVLRDENHVVESEIKAVTTPTIVITATNNDVSTVEIVEKDKTDDNAPKVEQSSTAVVS